MISECASYTNTLSAGIDMMKEVDVAGVVCLPAAVVQPSNTTPALSPGPQMVVQQSSIAMAVIMGLILLVLLILGR